MMWASHSVSLCVPQFRMHFPRFMGLGVMCGTNMVWASPSWALQDARMTFLISIAPVRDVFCPLYCVSMEPGYIHSFDMMVRRI